MDSFSESRCQKLIPSYLYSSSQSSSMNPSLASFINIRNPTTVAAENASPAIDKSFMIQALNELRKIEMYSPTFYAACTFGGSLSCGLTHVAVTPLDLVKCNMQGFAVMVAC